MFLRLSLCYMVDALKNDFALVWLCLTLWNCYYLCISANPLVCIICWLILFCYSLISLYAPLLFWNVRSMLRQILFWEFKRPSLNFCLFDYSVASLWLCQLAFYWKRFYFSRFISWTNFYLLSRSLIRLLAFSSSRYNLMILFWIYAF